jgi:FkbH-like protein
MESQDFLFPRDLEVVPTTLTRILIIGSCLSEVYVRQFGAINPQLQCDHILFNHATELPEIPSPPESYQLQYVQIPLRSVLTDSLLRVARLHDAAEQEAIYRMAEENLTQSLDAALAYHRAFGLLTLVAGFIVPQGQTSSSLSAQNTRADLRYLVAHLNRLLAARVSRLSGVFFADVDMLGATLGKRYFLDDSMVFYAHGSLFYPDWSGHEEMPQWTAPAPGRIEPLRPLGETYESRVDEFLRAVYRQIVFIYRAVLQTDAVKVVIFDLDNTLWRGQLAEHYRSGLEWPYTDGWPLGLWEAVHHLQARGIATTLCSKNDHETVASKWDEVVQPPFLKLTDFLNPKINWRPKAENIAEILAELNLTAASALFVDDSPIERESVRAALPGIRVIGGDPFVVRRILLWSAETQVVRITDETRHRQQRLQENIVRDARRRGVTTEEFLATLQTSIQCIEIRSVEQTEFNRAFELVNKTNQFNTTGKRWNFQECQAFLALGGRILAFSVSDKFSSHGLVGVVFINADVVVQFVMSCRILGMGIELAVLARIVTDLRGSGGLPVQASILKTESNSPCRDLFSRAGFEELWQRNATTWYRLPAGRVLEVPSHIVIA